MVYMYKIKGMFTETLDLFTRLGHDQMDYNYRYIINYMYMYALTTNFLFIFSRVLYIYCQLKLID
jgi:hypothetical protein